MESERVDVVEFEGMKGVFISREYAESLLALLDHQYVGYNERGANVREIIRAIRELVEAE
jgi:hypothetical protein